MRPISRYRNEPHLRFLKSREWAERIRPRQLRVEPLCRFCRALGYVTVADHVDHIIRPGTDFHLQRDPANLQSLCAEHHGTKTRCEEGNCEQALVIGHDQSGWPITWTPATGIQGV